MLVVSLLETLFTLVFMDAVLAAMVAFHRPSAEPRMVELRLSFAMPVLRLTRDIMVRRQLTRKQKLKEEEVSEVL